MGGWNVKIKYDKLMCAIKAHAQLCWLLSYDWLEIYNGKLERKKRDLMRELSQIGLPKRVIWPAIPGIT